MHRRHSKNSSRRASINFSSPIFLIRATEFADKAGLFVVCIIKLVLGQEGVTAQIPQSHALGYGNVLGVENLPHLGEGRV